MANPFDAWCDGYGMAVRGFLALANPYRGRGKLARDWAAGFAAAVVEGKWGSYLP